MKLQLSTETIYEIEEQIGEGAHACVYRAKRRDLLETIEQTVALKILKSETAVEIWRREFCSLQAIRSRHCVQFYGFERINDSPALVLEFIDGLSLMDLQATNQIKSEDIFEILRQIHQGLLDLKSQGLCHGDLSPQNVLIDRRGIVKLVDFGLANTEGVGLASPLFVSPERISGQRADYYSDLYSLGKILDWLLRVCPWSAHELHKLAMDLTKNSPIERKFILLQKKQQASGLASYVQLELNRREREKFQTKTINLMQQQTVLSRSRFKFLVLRAVAAISLIFSFALTPHGRSLPLQLGVAGLNIRTQNWVQVSLNGKNLGYSPLNLKNLPQGHYKLEWKTAKASGHRALTLSSGEIIFLNDKDFME